MKTELNALTALAKAMMDRAEALSDTCNQKRASLYRDVAGHLQGALFHLECAKDSFRNQ